MASILELRQVSYRYPENDRKVFAGIDLSIGAGEFIAVVGGSGVGKSTLLRVAAGLTEPASGEVRVHLESPETRAGTSRERAIVFQDGRLFPWRRLRGNVAYGLGGLSLDAASKAQRVDEVLALTRLSEFADRWPHQLSGGQIQRAGIARALAVHPGLLLMDEPFSAVDAITRRHLQDELQNIWQNTGAGVLFITHDIEEAVFLADRVVILAGDGEAPAAVRCDHRVDLPRPRQRNSRELQEIAASIAANIR